MVKHVPRVCLLLLACGLLLVAAGLAWVSAKPRDMADLVPHIEKALNPAGGSFRVTVEGGHLDWRYAHDLGRISLRNVRMELPNGQVFAALPEIKVRLSPLYMLLGRVEVDWLIIPDVAVVLTSKADRQLYLGFDKKSATIPLASLFASDAQKESGSMRLPFAHGSIENAQIYIRNADGKLRLRTYGSNLTFNRTSYGIEASLDAHFTYRDQKGSAAALMRYYERDAGLTAAAKIINTPLGLLCSFVGDCGELSGIRGALTGQVAFNMQGGAVSEANATLVGQRMQITRPEIFAEPLEFTEMGISAEATNGLKNIAIKTFSLKSQEMNMAGSATAAKAEEGWSLKLAASMRDFNVRHLQRYWPVTLAPETREWVTTNINKGMSPQSSIVVDLRPEDFTPEFFPDRFLKATIGLTNTSIKFLPGIAPLTGVDATVVFTGETMRAKLSSGKLLTGTTLSAGEVYCPNLNDPVTPMEASLTLAAKARDVATVLKHPSFTFDDILTLNDNALKGDISGTLRLGFNAFGGEEGANSDKFDVSGVTYGIDTHFTDLTQPKLMGSYDVSGMTGNLKADNDGFSVDGKGTVNGNILTLSAAQKTGGDAEVSAAGTMTRDALVKYGMPDRPEIGAGSIGFDARFTAKKDATIIDKLSLDLKNAALSVPDISWEKPLGISGTVAIAATDQAAGRYSLSADAGDLSAQGSFTLDPKTQSLTRLSLTKLQSPKSAFSLDYTTVGKGFSVSIKGDRLDNSTAYTATSTPNENSLLADFPLMKLDIELAKLTLAPAHPFTNVKGTLDCVSGPCVAANIRAATGEKGIVTASITNIGARTLGVIATDAGEFLRAVDITDRVYGGKLELKGLYTGDIMNGRLIIEKFNVKQSEVLGRLFGVASLSGLSNLLTGSGIDFEKLSANIASRRGVITITEGRASGASTGYTTEGTVDTRNATLDLKGVLVPAYMFNSAITKIPVIGAIAGGEGEGLFSFNYAIKGPYSDPSVSVNPLSGLTPGFLRNIFNAGDAPVVVPGKELPPEAEKPVNGSERRHQKRN